MHHGRILNKAVHEHHAHAPVAGARRATFEQSAADTLTSAPRQNGNTQLGMSVLAREVGRTNDFEIDASDNEDGATCQVDTFDVVAYTII
jgi:hypothetical protein